MRFLVMAVAFAASLGAATADAQAVTVRMSTDRTDAVVGEALTLQIQLEIGGVDVDHVTLPSFEGFNLVGRTSASSTVNFKTSMVYTFVLVPQRPGKFRIGGAQVSTRGRVIESNAVTVTVTGEGEPGPTDDSATPDGSAGKSTDNFNSTAFIRTIVSNPEPYVGEQVTVSVVLYSREQLQQTPETTTELSTPGFWVQDLFGPNRSIETRASMVNGRQFYTYELKRMAAFPLAPGERTMGAMELRMVVGRPSLFDSNQRVVTAKGAPVTFQIKAIPTDGTQPKNVVVGHYAIETSLDRSKTRTGDALTVTAKVQGEGNIGDVVLELPAQKGLRVFEPQTTQQIAVTGSTLTGSRTWSWLVVPDEPGTYTLPPLTLTEFVPATKTFETVASAPLTFEAEGKAIRHAATLASGGDSADSKRDEPLTWGVIRSTSELRRHSVAVMHRPWYPWVVATPPALWFMALMFALGRRRFWGASRSPQIALAQRAAEHLALARTFARSGNAQAFYAEVTAALRTGLDARLGEATGGLTHGELRAHLSARGVPEDLTKRIVDELEGFDFARFAASASDLQELSHCSDRVDALLTRIARVEPLGRSAGGENRP